MKILVQVGNLGGSIIDHRMRPLAQAENVEKVLLVCHHLGPEIPKLEYHCPPKFISRFALAAVVYEFFTLLYLSIFKKPNCLSGYLLFPHGLMAFIVAKLTRRPVILSLIAGPVEIYATGSPLGVDFEKSIPRLGGFFLKLLKHSDAITTTGSFTKSFLVKRGVRADNIYPIINPPNNCRVQPMQIPKKYDVIWLGRIAPVKHLDVLLHATAQAKNKFGDIKVCIVGDGPCMADLLKLAHELGINDNIDFMGFQKDVAYYYNSSRIFTLTSEREGFPNVFLEALSCGLPAVVSNCGDITDIAKDGFNCIVIQKYDDYERLAEAIIRLLEEKELYHRLSRNALKTIRDLSVEKVARDWDGILRNLGIQE